LVVTGSSRISPASKSICRRDRTLSNSTRSKKPVRTLCSFEVRLQVKVDTPLAVFECSRAVGL